MRFFKKLTSVVLSGLMLATGISNVFVHGNNDERENEPSISHDINIAVISYSDSRFDEIYNQISNGGQPIECTSDKNGKKYKLEFKRLPELYEEYNDEEYISNVKDILSECWFCIFHYDLSKDKEVMKKECLRWSKAIETANCGCYILFLPDSINTIKSEEDIAYMFNWSARMASWCEDLWIKENPKAPQCMGSVPIPIRINDIVNHICKYIHIQENYYEKCVKINLLVGLGLTGIGIGTVVGVRYGIYKGVKKFINKKPAVKTKSLQKVKNLV